MTDCTFKQTYAELDWQNKEQLPIKDPENELFTVKYSEVASMTPSDPDRSALFHNL